MNKYKIIYACFLLLILPMKSQGENLFHGKIIKIQGHVYILNRVNENVSVDKDNIYLKIDDTVVTDTGSKAVIEFNDGYISVLDEKSKLRMERSGLLSQLSGKVYYIFKKVFTKQPRKIQTTYATIGIRGTTFIVNVGPSNNSIALKEGGLNIESPNDVFKIIKKPVAYNYSDFKQETEQAFKKMSDEYQKYKQNINEEFIEYKKIFSLEPDSVVSFNNNVVTQGLLSDDLNLEFQAFDDFYSAISRPELDREDLD
ncbi:MAG: FecR family protein [Gammaproteobacteria bacterium]|nr:FecR family protein [Gammaproteobacteria bacterium]